MKVRKKVLKNRACKEPFAMQKRLYESMERHLDAAIEKVESLARDNQQGKRWCVEVCPRLTFFMDGDIYYETKKKL